jgi:hypothetical protein
MEVTESGIISSLHSTKVPKSNIELIKFANTEEFRREALYFQKYGRYDCGPRGTLEYKEYWKEQKLRCKEGYSVAGVRITGEHYGYLNFGRIEKTQLDEKGASAGERIVKNKKAEKKISFPDFWDGDYMYFHAKDIARNGGWFKGKQYLGGQHLCVAKKRRGGYSYKNGWIAANTYKMIPRSVTLLCAYETKYLYPKGTFQMTYEYVDWINRHTNWRRRKLKDSQDHIIDGYEVTDNGISYERGYLSHVMALSFGSNASAARGKDGTLILVEEAGKAPNLMDFYMSTQPLVEDGDYVTGQIIIFGTGGDDNTNWEDFEKMFYEPDSFNMMAFENEWDEGMKETSCGFFVPEYMNRPGSIDGDGNSDIPLAKEKALEKRRQIANSSKDQKILNGHIMERPFCPAEAFSRSGTNFFPVVELREWRNKLFVTGKYKTAGDIGELYSNSLGEIDFRLNREKRPVWDYPIKKGEDNTGAVIRYFPPLRKNGKVIENLYVIDVDTYRHDNSTGDSVGAAYVWIRPNSISGDKGERIVASYVGRPNEQDDFNEVVYNLARYYNAKIGFENDEPGGLLDYAKRFPELNLIDYLEEEFELAYDEKLTTSRSKVKRKYGMHMGSGKENLRKKQGDLYIKEWLSRVRATDFDGNEIKNLHTIYDIGLLDELIKYIEGKNYDRVASMRLTMYHFREIMYNDAYDDEDDQDPRYKNVESYFNRPKYQDYNS